MELLRQRLCHARDEQDMRSLLGVLAELPDAVQKLLKVHERRVGCSTYDGSST